MPTPGKDKPIIAVLGVGAVGGFISALFYKQGYEVTGIARKAGCEIVVESKSFGNFTAKPRIITALDKKCDVLFVTVKANSLKESLERINLQYVRGASIVPLLNGLEHMDILRHYFGARVIAASIGNIEVKRSSDNRIIHTTKSGTVWLTGQDKPVIDLIKSIGLQVEICETENSVLWGKLVRLCALACTTAASGRPVGFIRSDKIWREKLVHCLNEAAKVALKEGVTIDVKNNIDKIDAMPEDLSTSMARDVAAGKPGEIDAIAGAVIRAGRKHGMNCPVIQEMVDKL